MVIKDANNNEIEIVRHVMYETFKEYADVLNFMYIGRVSVLPTYRGKGGIGKALITYLEDLAKTKGYWKARIEVRKLESIEWGSCGKSNCCIFCNG